MNDGTAAESRPSPPDYRQMSHRAHLDLTLATFGFWLPFWAMITAAVAISNRRAKRRYERSLIDWALAQCREDGGERIRRAVSEAA